jgi:osmotically-inducible protein OsmY
MSRLPSFVLGAAVGAGGYFFLDPQHGKRRQNTARDKALKYARMGSQEAARRAEYAVGAAKGAVQEQVPGGGEKPAKSLNDAALARKVETEIFRPQDVPKGKVSVNVEDGVVYLRGEVDQQDMIDRLGEEARKVEGVQGVKNLLHVPGAPAPMKE